MDNLNSTTAITLPSSADITVKHVPIKRIFDIVFSFTALTIGFPLFAIVALLVRFSSKGNIIYSHERIGRGGKAFRCYKFRTMHPHADQRLKDILAKDAKLKEEWEQNHKLKDDPRITFIGKFLRKTSMDELPQFWNVLKGDLSVVGPRPVVRAEVLKCYGPKAAKILSVRPGLTGLWQISGRNNTSYSKRIQLDETYIDTHSLALDCQIIAKTVPAILASKGAY